MLLTFRGICPGWGGRPGNRPENGQRPDRPSRPRSELNDLGAVAAAFVVRGVESALEHEIGLLVPEPLLLGGRRRLGVAGDELGADHNLGADFQTVTQRLGLFVGLVVVGVGAAQRPATLAPAEHTVRGNTDHRGHEMYS